MEIKSWKSVKGCILQEIGIGTWREVIKLDIDPVLLVSFSGDHLMFFSGRRIARVNQIWYKLDFVAALIKYPPASLLV